jgi:hypothetical protein
LRLCGLYPNAADLLATLDAYVAYAGNNVKVAKEIEAAAAHRIKNIAPLAADPIVGPCHDDLLFILALAHAIIDNAPVDKSPEMQGKPVDKSAFLQGDNAIYEPDRIVVSEIQMECSDGMPWPSDKIGLGPPYVMPTESLPARTSGFVPITDLICCPSCGAIIDGKPPAVRDES